MIYLKVTYRLNWLFYISFVKMHRWMFKGALYLAFKYKTLDLMLILVINKHIIYAYNNA